MRCRPGGATTAPAAPAPTAAGPTVARQPMRSKYERAYITELGARRDMAHVQVLHDLHACARVAAPDLSDEHITNWIAYELPPKLIDLVRTKVRTLNLVANRRMTPTMLRVGVLDRLAVYVRHKATEDRGIALVELDKRDLAAFGAVGTQVLPEADAYLPAGPHADHAVHFISTESGPGRGRAGLARVAKPIFEFYATHSEGADSNIFKLAPVVAALRAEVTRGVPEASIYDMSREKEGMRKCLARPTPPKQGGRARTALRRLQAAAAPSPPAPKRGEGCTKGGGGGGGPCT